MKFILIIFTSQILFAHSLIYSYIDITKNKKDKWETSINAPYGAYVNEFIASHTKEDIKKLSPNGLKKWIKIHIKNKLSIYNEKNKKINFDAINIKLGHEVYANFELKNTTKNTQTFRVVSHIFNNIQNSKYILKIHKKAEQ